MSPLLFQCLCKCLFPSQLIFTLLLVYSVSPCALFFPKDGTEIELVELFKDKLRTYFRMCVVKEETGGLVE